MSRSSSTSAGYAARSNSHAQELYRAREFVDHDRYLMTRRISDRPEP